MTLTGKVSQWNGNVKTKQIHHKEEHEEHVPCWLQWTLAFLIVSNIFAYFLVTWSTIKDLDKQIKVLKNRQSSSLLPDITTSTDWSVGMKVQDDRERIKSANKYYTLETTFFTLGHIHQTNEIFEDEIRTLEEQKHAILLGTLMEIFLDSVDLINTFVHNFWVHVIYTVVKITSVGLWTYAQADLPFQAFWFVPIGIAVLISLLLLEWHTSARKVFLVLLIVASSLAWILIVTIRSDQNKDDIEKWTERSHDPRQNRTMCEEHIRQLRTDMAQFIAATVVMVLLGLFGLLTIWLANLCTGIVFSLLYLSGDLWWISMVSSQDDFRDHLFQVPLVYALLIAAVSMLYLYDLYHVQCGHPHSSSFLKRVPCMKKQSSTAPKRTTLKTPASFRGGKSNN